MTSTLIKEATIYDGSGNLPFKADALIEGEQIAKIAPKLTHKAATIIDAAGLALAPGFIDTHSHSDLEVFRNPSMKHVIQQGVTTEIIGQDGSSVAPVHKDILGDLADNMAPLAGVVHKSYWWRGYGSYLEEITKAQPATRVEGLIGHGTVRMNVMGNDNRTPTDTELCAMKELVAQGIREGAKGLSLGLIYPPGSYAKTEELIEICKVVADFDGIVMVHMRNEQDQLLQSLGEMATIAEATGVRMHISHLKALGYRNWGNVGVALAEIKRLRSQGLDITFDQYPYAATCTGLKVVVPAWAYEGGERGFMKRLEIPAEYKRVLAETKVNIEARGGGKKILIASVATEENSWMAGAYLDTIAERLEFTAAEAALQILKNEGPSVVAIYFSISDDDVQEIMKSSLQGICTDGIVGAHPHPRAFGSFPRVLGYYTRELGLMTMQEAIRKMTMEPARRLRLWDRGLIRVGMSADLVLFDPQVVIDDNSYVEPKKAPLGIKKVWVLGQLKFSNR